jgi:dinuclear metal center YbgI/SA1388 family protein
VLKLYTGDKDVIFRIQLYGFMKVKDIIQEIEAFAPPAYQESYDNSGLQVGDAGMEVTGVLLSLDVTEEILEEALQRGCNMVVVHHPLLFSGLKRIAGRNYVERIVIKAIKSDIAVYAAHTNLDNVRNGVNAKIAEKLGLKNTRILSPMPGTLCKLYTYAPVTVADAVRDAMLAVGAGDIGQYAECSFNTHGTGTFKPGADTSPVIGEAGGAREWVEEVKIEVLVQKDRQARVLQALFASHPYEEVAYEIVALQNTNQDLGAGMVGELPDAMQPEAFLAMVKDNMQTGCIRHTVFTGKNIKKVALCGGAGSFLLKNAIAVGADVFMTGDYKYHQFFDAEGKIIIADIGHYESEQYTTEIFADILNKKFPNFAILLSNLSTNPVKYFC